MQDVTPLKDEYARGFDTEKSETLAGLIEDHS
jgi:hypothetical protein